MKKINIIMNHILKPYDFLRRSWLALVEIFPPMLVLSLLLLLLFKFLEDYNFVEDSFFKIVDETVVQSLLRSYYGKPFLIHVWLSAYKGLMRSSGFHLRKHSIKFTKSSSWIRDRRGLLNIYIVDPKVLI
jgi:hypothetical protein